VRKRVQRHVLGVYTCAQGVFWCVWYVHRRVIGTDDVLEVDEDRVVLRRT